MTLTSQLAVVEPHHSLEAPDGGAARALVD